MPVSTNRVSGGTVDATDINAIASLANANETALATKVTAAQAAAAAPVQSVNGQTGAVTISAGGTVSDASTSAKGIVQLAGDLGGTAASPTVPGLASKADLVAGKVPASQLPSATSAPVVTKSAPYTAVAGEHVEMSGTNTVTLPASPVLGAFVGVTNTGSGTVSVVGSGGATVNGDATGVQLLSAGAGGTFRFDGAGWWVAVSGLAGPTGPTGPAGTSATVTVGTTTTGAAGSSATVTNSGTTSSAVLNFTIPQGAAGSGGGAALETTTAPPGTNTTGSVLGTATTAAHADHTHQIGTHDHTTTAKGGQVPIGGISATGTASATTYLRGDGSWSTPSGGGGSAFAAYGAPVSGRYVQVGSGQASAAGPATNGNEVWYTAWIVDRAVTVTNFGIEVTTAVASGTASIAIYSDSAGLPSSRLLAAQSIDCSTTGGKEATGLSVALSAGTRYWFALHWGGLSALNVRTVQNGQTNASRDTLANIIGSNNAIAPLVLGATSLTDPAPAASSFNSWTQAARFYVKVA